MSLNANASTMPWNYCRQSYAIVLSPLPWAAINAMLLLPSADAACCGAKCFCGCAAASTMLHMNCLPAPECMTEPCTTLQQALT